MRRPLLFLALLLCCLPLLRVSARAQAVRVPAFASQLRDLRLASSVSILKGFAGQVNGTRAHLQGYYNVADGGEGEFAWSAVSTATDNGGTVIQPTAGGTGRWLRLTDGRSLSVRWFGAHADGATDDRPAILATLQALPATGGEAYLPPGNYAIGSELFWPTGSNLSLVGAGAGRTVLISTFNGNTTPGVYTKPPAIFAQGTSGAPISGIHITDLTIHGVGNSDALSCFEGIVIGDYVSNIYIERCEFYWCWAAGTRVTVSNPGARIWISENYYHDCATPQMDNTIAGGAHLGALPRMVVRGNVFENCGNNNLAHGMYLSGGTDAQITSNKFNGLFTNLTFGGIISGLPVDHAPTIVGNEFKGSKDFGLETSSSPGTVITGNSFYDSAIRVDADATHITGNTFQFADTTGATCLEGGIWVGSGQSPQDVLIADNLFRSVVTATQHVINAIFCPSGSGPLRWTIQGNYFTGTSQGYDIRPLEWDATSNKCYFVRNRIQSHYNHELIWFRGGSGHVIAYNEIEGNQSGNQVLIWDRTMDPTNVAFGNRWLVGSVQPIIGPVIANADALEGTPQVLPMRVGQRRSRFYAAAVAYDPPNLADAASASTTVSVPGVRPGDTTSCEFSNLVGQNFAVRGSVSGLDTVTVWFRNETGAPVDLAQGRLSVSVKRTYPDWGDGATELTGSATWDPGTLADTVSATTTIAVATADVGDAVTPNLSQIGNAWMTLEGYILAPGVVTVVATNRSGGSLSVGSGTLSVRVRKL